MTLYEVLEVSPTASTDTITAAYAALTERCSQERSTDLPAEMQLQADRSRREIDRAYAVLRDPVSRADYDRQAARFQETTSPRRVSDVGIGIANDLLAGLTLTVATWRHNVFLLYGLASGLLSGFLAPSLYDGLAAPKFYPGFIFGLIFATALFRRGLLSRGRALALGVVSTLANYLATALAYEELDWTGDTGLMRLVAGIIAGGFGGATLAATMYTLVDRRHQLLLTNHHTIKSSAIVGAAAGGFGLMVLAPYGQTFSAKTFYVVWQGSYAAVLFTVFASSSSTELERRT